MQQFLMKEKQLKHAFANLKAKVNGEVVNYEVHLKSALPGGCNCSTTVGENGEVVLTNT